MKDLDIFGVEKLRGDLEEQIRQLQKPHQSVYASESNPAAPNAMPIAEDQPQQAVNTKGQILQTPRQILHVACEQ